MNRIKIMGLALMAAFAFSAVAAATASAQLGPFYKVNGNTLKAGETRLLLASAKANFKLEAVGLKQTITCEQLSLEGGQDLIEGGLIGKSKEVIQYSLCTQTGNGTECEILSGKITTAPVLNLLGYSNSNKTGLVLVLFEPEVGKAFVTVKYTGKCTVASQGVTGTVGALAQVGGKPLEVGVIEPETLHGEVKFHKGSKTIWVEQAGGSLVATTTKLELQGNGATLEGTALVTVDEGGTPVKWGVFS